MGWGQVLVVDLPQAFKGLEEFGSEGRADLRGGVPLRIPRVYPIGDQPGGLGGDRRRGQRSWR